MPGAPDPKSGVSANSTTLACTFYSLTGLKKRVNVISLDVFSSIWQDNGVYGPLAQLVEQQTLNLRVLSSILGRLN